MAVICSVTCAGPVRLPSKSVSRACELFVMLLLNLEAIRNFANNTNIAKLVKLCIVKFEKPLLCRA